MKRLILLVGIPASGKSTLAEKLVERGFTCLNADSIRYELYGDEAEQGDKQKVFDIFFERLDKLLKDAFDVVIDNTNLKAKHRKLILDRAENCGYTDRQIWVLEVPLNVCLQRNSARTRKLDSEIVTNMYKQFNRSGRPTTSEGQLVTLRPDDKVSGGWLMFYR